jgi:hypothetical protein
MRFMLDDDAGGGGPLSGFGGLPKFDTSQISLNSDDSLFNPVDPGVKGNPPSLPGSGAAPSAGDYSSVGGMDFNSALRAFANDPSISQNAQTTQLWGSQGIPMQYLTTSDGKSIARRTDLSGGGSPQPTPTPGPDPIDPGSVGPLPLDPPTNPITPTVVSDPVIGAESVRATGTGSGFDPAYAENLAVFGAGGFNRSGGTLNVDPFATNPFEGFGAPVGGGNAPVYGGPQTLLESAMAASAATPPPAPAPEPAAAAPPPDPNQSYIDAIGGMDSRSALAAYANDPSISPDAQTTQLWGNMGIPMTYIRTSDGQYLARRTDLPAGGAQSAPLSAFQGGNGFFGGGGGDGGGIERMFEM